MTVAQSSLTARLEVLRPKLIVIFHESWKYFLVSAVSLAVDLALFWLLIEKAHVYYLIANIVSVSAGLIVNYALSVAFVFKERRLKSRWAEFVGFVVIGVLGLAVNEAGVAVLVGLAHLPPMIGKIGAAGVSFVFNFIVRRVVLFTDAK
jgi:putative flippase GtrA